MVPTRGKTTFVFNQKGNRFHYLVITCNGKESEKEYMYMYITESLCCTPESNIHCKSTTLQLKERKEGRKEEGRKEGRKEGKKQVEKQECSPLLLGAKDIPRTTQLPPQKSKNPKQDA